MRACTRPAAPSRPTSSSSAAATARSGRRRSSSPPFNDFRGRHNYLGIDTLALSSVDGARIFDRLKLKFEEGLLKPFPINPDCCYDLKDAAKAYASVLRGTPERVLLKP